jgi:hypothetical protein
MGEAKKKARTLVAQAVDTMVVDTGGGRMQVRWDETAQATPHGQLVFFAEFLRASGVFDQWVEACPLVYRSGNAPAKRDVLGTLMLSILAGHRRYAHITAVRGDAVAAQALGIAGMVSEDAVRRALKTIEAPASEAWMRPCLMRSVASALDRPWVLDIDASVKPLYGHQQGAEVGYNPHKPGRPSHVLHTYWVGNLRLVLDVQLNPGKQHTSVHAKAGLERLLEELGDKRPALVRGDCGYGNEGILGVLEERDQRYLLRLRQTKNVQRLIARQFARLDWTRADGQGWQAVEDRLQLLGWSRPRRVVIIRRRLREALAIESKRKGTQQLRLALADDAILDAARLWEYTVLATDMDYSLEGVAQLYRDRCDCENGFDELKNQWGLSGFTTQDLTRCQTTARAVALIYNWWSWYCRAAHPGARMEALTSRPLLLAAVGKAVSHAGQTLLYLTPLHAKVQTIKTLVANVRAALQHVARTAEQFPAIDRWAALLRYICDRIVGVGPPSPMLIATPATG